MEFPSFSSVYKNSSYPPRRFSSFLSHIRTRIPTRFVRSSYLSGPGEEEDMATFELYRRSTIGSCLTETLDDLVSSGAVSPELAIQVLVQFDKSITEALDAQVKSKVAIKGHLHTYRFCDNVWTFILTDATFKSEEISETLSKVKIVACDSKLLEPQP